MAKTTMLAMAAVLAAGFACAEGMSIVDARKQMVENVSNPAAMTATVKQLSAEDQRQYVGDVMGAIAKMPASQEEIASAYVGASRAMLKGAQKGNLPDMIAEVFATVPAEYLPVVCESLSGDMLNRAADKSRTYTDDEYIAIATNVMAKVNERAASSDASDVRSAFAAIAFIRGSNSAGENIVSALTAALPESARETASKEWFPAALAEGDAKNYDAMLVAASAEGIDPEMMTKILLRVSAPQSLDALVGDLYGAGSDPSAKSNEKNPLIDVINNPMLESLPSLGVGAAYDTFVEQTATPRDGDANRVPGGNEPGGYQWQRRR